MAQASQNSQQLQASQQEQANSMLNQLPQQQRSQIEQAVNTYRQQLVTQGFSSEVVQAYVWQYYTQCVQTLYKEHILKSGHSGNGDDASQSQRPFEHEAAATRGTDESEQRRGPSQMQRQLNYDPSSIQRQQNQGQLETSQNGEWEENESQPSYQQQHQRHQQNHMQMQMQIQMQQRRMQLQMQQNQFQASSLGSSFSASQNAGSSGSDWQQSKSGSCWDSSSKDDTGGDSSAAVPRPSQASSLTGGCGSSSSLGSGFNVSSFSIKSVSVVPPPWKSQPRPRAPGMVSPSGLMMMAPSSGQDANESGNDSSGAYGIGGSTPSSAPMRPGVRFPIGAGFQTETQVGRITIQAPSGAGMFGKAGWQVAAPRVVAPRPVGLVQGSVRGPRPGMKGGGCTGSGGMVGAFGAQGGGGGKAACPQFPPTLSKWLQKIFAQQAQSGENDPELQKATHAYFRHFLQQWVKSGELWKTNWDLAPLPTVDEIRRNLPPGSTSGARPLASGGFSASASSFSGGSNFSGPLGIGAKFRGGSPNRIGIAGCGANRDGFARPSSRPQRDSISPGKRSRSRTRSRSGVASRRRRGCGARSPRGRRRRSTSSSRSGNSRSRCSRRGSRSRDRSSESRPRNGNRPSAVGSIKGKGKSVAPVEVAGKSAEQLRSQVHAWLLERLQSGNGRLRELQEELQRSFNMNVKRFKGLFCQTLQQYIAAFNMKGPVGPEEAWTQGAKPALYQAPSKELPQGEQEMRSQRAARFQHHLQIERAPVAMVSFEPDDGCLSGGPIVGKLNEMCSREEAKEREQTRQLDKLEWKLGTDPRHPEVDLRLAVKKYQRSSADKAYRSQDVRSLDACWRAMEYLMTEVLDFDQNPKPIFAVQSIPYIEVYSFLRDRTRACRVDLHLQQPRSTTQRTFVETHECCLRFEMLSLFLLTRATSRAAKGGATATEKYDPKLGLKAISQTIEPLLNAYQAVRDKLVAKSILAQLMGDVGEGDDEGEEYSSAWEPAVHRYIVLLLMSFSPEELLTHLAKLSREILSHPLVIFATQVFAALQTDDYSSFLRCYKEADFLSAVAMSSVADLARLRALWLLVRCYPQPVGDRLALARLRNLLAISSDEHAISFLHFHGFPVVFDGSTIGPYVRLPKKGTPEYNSHPILAGPNRLPEKCEYPKGADSLLEAKYSALGLSRADLVFGSADPIAAPPEVATLDPEPEAPIEGALGDGDKVDGEKASGEPLFDPSTLPPPDVAALE